MVVRRFIGKVIDHYVLAVKAMVSSLFPATHYTKAYIPHKNYREYLTIYTEWLGQIIDTEVFELADNPRRRQFLKRLYEDGKISEHEYKKCLSPENNKDRH